ncbi:hypothetical protein BJ742DRAFT_298197 [Cladochytrium replicatum]|nr:hypothetical protein BJ742DRAFT_298197 [Cladochytrium replicatum]
MPKDFSNQILCSAQVSQKKNIKVLEGLEWWKSTRITFKCSEYDFRNASDRGCIEVLDWWDKQSGVPFEYWRERTMDGASEKGNTDVLECRHPVEWTNQSMDRPKSPEVLERWKTAGLE